MMFFIFLVFICTTISAKELTPPYKAVVIAPVINLIGQSMSNNNAQTLYASIPLCGGNTNRWISCPRTEQLLFNEIVDVLEKRGNEVKVAIPQAYYVTEHTSSKQHEYWTLAKDLLPLQTCTDLHINIKMFPKPFDFTKTTQEHRATVALRTSYYDPQGACTFSAGTRFICAKTPPQSDYITVFVYNHALKKMQKTNIPKHICIMYQKKRTHKELRALFVTCARAWTYSDDGFVPYVWGGSSVVYPYKGTFHEHTETHGNQIISFFEYPTISHKPHTGLDCSGLVRRAAQLAGIPFFYKNTYTIAHCMKPLESGHHLQQGDLIWTPGHIMIVSDIERNVLIEARSYFQGYGRVHEIALNKVFKHINTYADLEDCFFNKRALERIDIQGVTRNVLPHFLLLNLDCVLTTMSV